MPPSNSVLRRYTPPTCTLQIIARSSSLSRWAGRPVLKHLRFDLRLDDPQVPDDRGYHIQGDGEQLEALHREAASYVQHLLEQSPEHFSPVFSALAPVSPPAGASSPQELNSVAYTSPPGFEVSHASVPSHASALDSEEVTARELHPSPSGKQIYLRQGKGLTHDLFLGPLANEATGTVIPLSVLELFDLATALDEYAADLVALPDLGRSRFAAPPAWVNIAALVLVTAGLSTAVVQFLDRQHPQQQVATNATPQVSSGTPPDQTLQPSPLPGGTLPPLSAPETLPPALPPLGSTVPPAGLVPSRIPRTAPVPHTSGAVPLQRVPGLPGSLRSGAGQSIAINPGPVLPQAAIPLNLEPRQNKAAYNPFRSGVSAPGGGRSSSVPTSQFPAGAPRNLPPLSPGNPDLGTASLGASSSTSASSSSSTVPTASDRALTNSKEPKSTAFDTVPQVAEARAYFKDRWNPPSSLTQTLEYNLILDIDGKIQRIEPLTQAARNYIDRSGIPLIGEPFVSPNKNGQPVTIRVVLSPDGKVQTFPE